MSAGSRDAWLFFVRTHPAARLHGVTWVSSHFDHVRLPLVEFNQDAKAPSPKENT